MTESGGEVPAGLYRHFKGQLYEVLGVVRHSETDEALVIYRPQYGAPGLWARPLGMFRETVLADGRPQPRFQYLGPMSPAEQT